MRKEPLGLGCLTSIGDIKIMITLRISALLALIASSSAAFAAIWMGRLYAEFLKGAPLPKLTDAVLWNNGLWYWLITPLVVVALYALGERAKSERTKQRVAEVIMVLGVVTTSAFMIGAVLPLTRITVGLD